MTGGPRRSGALSELLAALALAAPPLLAVMFGAGGPLAVGLDLGPGAGPYLSGFWPRYEIVDRVSARWTSYDARVELPLEVSGGPVRVRYRFARVLAQSAEVELFLDERRLDRFTSRGGRIEEREATLGAVPPGTALSARFAIDSHDRQNRGLRLDRLQVEIGERARLRLAGAARWRAAVVVALLFALLRVAGWPRLAAAGLAAPVSMTLAATLLRDPWWAHRLLTGVPETVALAGAAGLSLARLLLCRGAASPHAVRAVVALTAAAFLLRAVAVNHPGFYYPDLHTHATLAETLRSLGIAALLRPAELIVQHGHWLLEAGERSFAFPYSPAFHLPFALAGASLDATVSAMKLAGALLSALPIALCWPLARRLGFSTAGVALLVVIPTYGSRLSYAFLPALLGHVFDLALILWLARNLDRLRGAGVVAIGALWVAAAQLAYVSGTLNVSLLMLSLALLEPRFRPPPRLPRVALLLALGLAGSALSVLLYYRGFLPLVLEFLPAVLAGDQAPRQEVSGLLEVAAGRLWEFFGAAYPALAALGLLRFFRDGPRPAGRGLVAAWLLTVALLLLGRARLPDVFAHGHETLLLTPLVCLAAGDALARLWASGGARRVAAAALGAFLVVQGLRLQWSALAAQLDNVR